jgi:hypothetical protein
MTRKSSMSLVVTLAFATVTSLTLHEARAESAGATTPPDFGGVWATVKPYRLLQTTDGKVLPLLPKAKQAYEHNIAARRAGDTSFDTTTTLCQPPGVPRTLLMSRFRILQAPDAVIFMFEWNHLRQFVYLNSAHVGADDFVDFMGDTVGKWEGDTLVVDTKVLNNKTLIDDALPHSDSLHVVERFHLKTDGKTLEDDMRIDDPETFSSSWATKVLFKKQPSSAELKEDVCEDREVTTFNKDAN